MNKKLEKIQKIQNLSFEEALQHLENTVTVMENNNNGLDEVIDNYEYGVELKKHLQQKLSEAKLKIEKITTESENFLIQKS